MITHPTTFVVGAGASNDYGLPTSAKLRQEVQSLTPRHEVYQLILLTKLCLPEQLNKILDDLRHQGTSSIDEFLFARQDDEVTMRVGRALIALLLATHLSGVKSPDTLGAGPPDWLGYIIEKMQSGAKDCEAFAQGNAEVRFVTFNFDSIIEERLEKALRNLYRGTAEEKLRDAISAVHRQVIHVHGKLKLPPPLPLRFNERRYSPEWVSWLSAAPSGIRVVLDQIDDDTLRATRQAVLRSEILCFLGFAYASENLTRLDLPSAITRGVDGIVIRYVFGTAFGIRPGEGASVKDRLGLDRAVLGGESESCFDFLRNQHIFRD